MSLIEVADGNIVDSESIVPVTVVKNVTSSRTFDVIYTNVTGKTMYVLVNVRNAAIAAGYQYCNLAVDGNYYSQAGIYACTANLTLRDTLTIVVPPGSTYQLSYDSAGGGTSIIVHWIESY